MSKNTLHKDSQRSEEHFVAYGFGATGKTVIDSMLDGGMELKLIIDLGKAGTTYRNIPVVSLDKIVEFIHPANYSCLISLHNHWVDIREIYASLTALGFRKIYSLAQGKQVCSDINLLNGFWLDFAFSYEEHQEQIKAAGDTLTDPKSQTIYNQIVQYRKYGHIPDCPMPSLDDEYTPIDLPRYQEPLQIIDCGAYNGTAIDRFLAADYKINSIVAFEPDARNFEKLRARDFKNIKTILLPLGVWSSNTQLRFSQDGAMSSHINTTGDSVIQCVKVDDAVKNYTPNIIKFDVEGAEIEALMGMEKTIRKYRPNLCISLYHKPEHLFEIPILINSWALNYQLHLRVHQYNTIGVVLYCINSDLAAQQI